MGWTVETLSAVDAEIENLPVKLRARLLCSGDAMTKLKDLRERLLEDAEFREEYARVDDEFKLIEALVRARMTAKLTQLELARRLGTTQSAIARLEGGRVSPSFKTLRRYAEATGTRLTVGLVHADR